MYLVINKCINAVKCSNLSGHYLRNRSTLDIGVLGYIGILYIKEHPPEDWHISPGTPCVCMCMYVCMNIWMYLCMLVSMYVFMYVCIYLCMYVRIYEFMYLCFYVCLQVCVCIYVHILMYLYL